MQPDSFLGELPPALRHLIEPDDAPASVPRRRFMKLAGAGGLALGVFPLIGNSRADAATPATLKPTQQPSAFLQIDANGAVTVAVNRLEFGQGVQTALPMILAEELDADWSRVTSRLGDNSPAFVDPTSGLHLPGGSSSIRNSYQQYRELGARARAMLLAAAAARWNVDVATLQTRNGRVSGPGGRQAGYGELADAAMAQPVPETVTLKDPRDFRLIGKPTGRLDARAKSSGRQSFGIDMRLPGMLTAVIARPPVFGARLRAVDDRAARAVRGVKGVFRVPLDLGAEGVAVVADSYWSARQGREALQLDWDDDKVEKVDSTRQLARYRELAGQPGSRWFDADIAALATAPHRIEAEFVFPYLAHAAMEPLNCTVQLTADRAELWTGSQMPGLDVTTAAKVLGLRPEQVRIHVQSSGGGFGRRAMGNRDYVVDACRVARAARTAGLNAPVRLLWSREDDMRGGFYRPMHLHRAHIGFDQRGRVLAWDHAIVAQSITDGTMFGAFMIKDGIDRTAVEGMREPYPLPMRLTVHHPKLNVPVHWWRSVGSTHTAFVMETLVDEIASRTRQDPVAYRLRLFGGQHPRHRAALELAVEKSRYGRKPLPSGHAWGVAVHQSFGTVVAYVVEASIRDGRPVLHRVTAGVHCNLAVNPRTVEAQLQGAAVMGLSTCLQGAAITLKEGQVEQRNFGDFTVARITDMPAFDVHIVPSADPPTGMGEPGLPPLAPAFANAIARLTGKRQRGLPFQL
ncbi:carbon monoxide dehydrogenase [Cupriavidus sp. SK-4]|uniref:xanthine dehydrogenase family protein molybdopterin-binding subunit n=1 Tax=Cupriavidus sp. SK-4 TaxID=574750 RepID=UPI00044CF1D0|nr:xanthine dehydrogenase family protein molybdopterin-binding subunit [Cupriavidus sp. SK-4]EYS84934.1 carbon monoxide dehydrogenase [Cupriavidus sp. SK-4]